MLHSILSEERCEEILRIAKPMMKRSTVVDSITGEIKTDPIRTSKQTFLARGEISGSDESGGKVIEIYHASLVQRRRHADSFVRRRREVFGAPRRGEKNTKSGQQLSADGGQRVATVLLYLQDTEEGGETAFPDSEWIEPESEYAQQKFSECAKNGVAFKRRRRIALLLHNPGRRHRPKIHARRVPGRQRHEMDRNEVDSRETVPL